MKKYILLLFIVVSFYSCKQNVAVDFPPFEEKLVVVSYIEEGDDKYLVYVNKTIDPHLEKYWNYIDTSFATAKVMLSIDNVPFQLRRIPKYEYHKYISSVHNSYGRFFALDKKIENITNLKLAVEYEGKRIESECTPFPTPHIDNAFLIGTSKNLEYYKNLKLLVEASFPAGISYYRVTIIQSSRMVVIDSLHRIIYSGGTAIGYFKSNNGERKKEFTFTNVSFPLDTNQRKCNIIFSRIEKTYYDFALASKAQVGETDTFLPTETTEVPSNIRGGYGIFTAMSSDTTKVILY